MTRVLQVLIAALLSAMCVCGSAQAAIYWVDMGDISRANLDGSNPNPYYISGSNFIACSVAVDNTYIYWGDVRNEAIWRATLDGTKPMEMFIPGVGEPCSIAVDSAHIYWIKTGSGSIGRANIDGSEPMPSFIQGLSRPCGLAVNSEHIFWSSLSEKSIGRATIHGEKIEPDAIETLDNGPCGLAVNGTHVFWGSYGTEIGRADLDGSNTEPKFLTGLDRPCGVAINQTQLYWSEGGVSGGVGVAGLDGLGMRRGLAGRPHQSCPIALDSLWVPPVVVPPPPTSICSVYEIKRNKWKGTAFVMLDAQAHSDLSITTKGLRWRVLTDPISRGGSRRWVLKVWPGGEGRAGKNLRQKLRRVGRVSLQLRITCGVTSERLLPATTTVPLVLQRVKRHPVR